MTHATIHALLNLINKAKTMPAHDPIRKIVETGDDRGCPMMRLGHIGSGERVIRSAASLGSG